MIGCIPVKFLLSIIWLALRWKVSIKSNLIGWTPGLLLLVRVLNHFRQCRENVPVRSWCRAVVSCCSWPNATSFPNPSLVRYASTDFLIKLIAAKITRTGEKWLQCSDPSKSNIRYICLLLPRLKASMVSLCRECTIVHVLMCTAYRTVLFANNCVVACVHPHVVWACIMVLFDGLK